MKSPSVPAGPGPGRPSVARRPQSGTWPVPIRRARPVRGAASADRPDRDVDAPGADEAIRASWALAFPATTAELAGALRREPGAPTGVLVLGRGPVSTPGGLPVDDGPLCVPLSVPVVLVAPPVVGAAVERGWRAQEAIAGGPPRVLRVGSRAEADTIASRPGEPVVLVVVEGDGTCWARRPSFPGERVPLLPCLAPPAFLPRTPRHRAGQVARP